LRASCEGSSWLVRAISLGLRGERPETHGLFEGELLYQTYSSTCGRRTKSETYMRTLRNFAGFWGEVETVRMIFKILKGLYFAFFKLIKPLRLRGT